MDLRGASAAALAELTEALEPALAGDGATIGTELFGVAGTLRAEPALRRVATDVSVAEERRSALVRTVLEDKVRPGTRDLAAAAAEKRWNRPRDLADSLEHLGVVALVRSAGDDSGRLSDELFAVARLVREHPDLRDALSNPARTVEDKRGLVHGLLEGKALPATAALVDQALAGTHRTVGVALGEYQEVAAEVHGRNVAEVRVAQPLGEDDRQRLAAALHRQYGRPVHLNMVVDPEVIGGIRVEVGNDVIDGTVSSRLDEARRKLAG